MGHEHDIGKGVQLSPPVTSGNQNHSFYCDGNITNEKSLISI